jgi:hypothetical protein
MVKCKFPECREIASGGYLIFADAKSFEYPEHKIPISRILWCEAHKSTLIKHVSRSPFGIFMTSEQLGQQRME